MSITLSELEEIVMIESGEYLLLNIENLTLTTAKFWAMVKRVLKYYEGKCPFVYKHNLTVSSGKYTYQDSVSYGPPDWISSVVPTTSSNIMDVYSVLSNKVAGETSLLEIPRGFVWKYENPNLYVSEDGIMDVVECHAHQYTETDDSAGVLQEVTISTITQKDDSKFIDLVLARFLMMLGRSRRAFTMNDLPITSDGDQLVSEGQELWRDTVEKLEETDKWYLALSEGAGV